MLVDQELFFFKLFFFPMNDQEFCSYTRIFHKRCLHAELLLHHWFFALEDSFWDQEKPINVVFLTYEHLTPLWKALS